MLEEFLADLDGRVTVRDKFMSDLWHDYFGNVA